jgi:hypothetical protein
MLKSLRSRLERLETARSSGVIEILRLRQDGGAAVTEIRNGRIVRCQEVTAKEAARLARGAVELRRSYGGALG